MTTSAVPLLKLIFTIDFAPTPMDGTTDRETTPNRRESRSALTSPTICTQFKAQLSSLMAKIQSTKPHYIRCLKPNDQNKPDLLNRVRTTEQLRYGGVLEAVRVARSGFPVRLSHEEFYGRYRPLANPFNSASRKLPRFISPKLKSAEKADAAKALLALLWDISEPTLSAKDKAYALSMKKIAEFAYIRGPPSSVIDNSIQLGVTKMFLRKQAHDLFEGRRSRRMTASARRIQACVRRWLARLKYLVALRRIFRLQIAIRYFLFHSRFVKKRRAAAATRTQTAYRCHLHLRRFTSFKSAMVSLQQGYRSKLAYRKVDKMRKVWRTIISLQCMFRRGRAKNELKRLRVAAKDVGNLKLEMERLRAQTAAQAIIDNAEREREAIRARDEALEREKEEARILLERMQEEARVQHEKEKEELRLKHESEKEAARVALHKEKEETRLRLENEARIQAEALEAEQAATRARSELLDRERAAAKAMTDSLKKERDELSTLCSSQQMSISELESKVKELEVNAVAAAEVFVSCH
jgi:myosin-5